MIEEGRRKRPIIPREERICKTCNKIEDEVHFLIDCDKYKECIEYIEWINLKSS